MCLSPVRRCAPSEGGAATRPPGSAGCSSSSRAPWSPRLPWPSTPSWRQRRTTSTSTASGTCWSQGAWASSCRPVPSPTPRWPRWSVGGAAAINCALTSTRSWVWWTRPLSPLTASVPADKPPHPPTFYLRDTSLPSFTWEKFTHGKLSHRTWTSNVNTLMQMWHTGFLFFFLDVNVMVITINTTVIIIIYG